MQITLTCPCGQKQLATAAMVGQTVACITCATPIRVPAMGVPETAKPKARPTLNALLPLVFVGAGLMLLLVLSGVWLAWALSRPTPIEAKVVQTDEPPRRETPGEERRPEKQDELPSRPKLEEKKPILERSKIDTPANKIVEPAPLLEPPGKVVQPVKQTELPKKVVEPVKPIETPKKNLIEPVKLVWKLREGETFFQELGVTQKPTFKVQGLLIAMDIRYHIVSRFTVKKHNKDGSLVVEQTIVSARLLQADDLSKQSIVAALLQLAGTTYVIELSPQMEVAKFDGAKDNRQVRKIEIAGMAGMQTSTLIDRDGWKELAQATFFQFDQTPSVNQRWAKPITHNWGSLGSWQGKIHYLYLGPDKGEHVIRYGLDLAYKAPAAGAALSGMKVNSADFKPHLANGMLRFDTGRGRVVYAEEVFHVKGAMNVNLVGLNQTIEIDEHQHFVIRIHDKQP